MGKVEIETVYEVVLIPNWLIVTVAAGSLGAVMLLAWIFWPRRRD